jgi:hypothetical protein
MRRRIENEGDVVVPVVLALGASKEKRGRRGCIAKGAMRELMLNPERPTASVETPISGRSSAKNHRAEPRSDRHYMPTARELVLEEAAVETGVVRH